MAMYRKAQPEDLDAMMEILADGQAYLKAQGVDQWQNGYPTRQAVAADIAGGSGYVAEEGGRLVGVASLVFGHEADYAGISGAWGADEPYAAVHRIAMRAGLRGGAVAGGLLATMEAACRAAKTRWLRADTHPDNQPMRRFLEKNGFVYRGDILLTGPAIQGADPRRVAYDKRLEA